LSCDPRQPGVPHRKARFTSSRVHPWTAPTQQLPSPQVQVEFFYGTTFRGGAGTLCAYYTVVTGCGTVFQLTQAASGEAWTETVLHSFTGLDGDGAFPAGSLVVGGNGSLYGTTQYGGSATFGSPCTSNGASGCGTAFVLTPPAVPGGAWTESVLHSFTGTNGDGAIPEGPLLLSPTGVLYGTTSAGGTANYGTVFSLMLN